MCIRDREIAYIRQREEERGEIAYIRQREEEQGEVYYIRQRGAMHHSNGKMLHKFHS